MDKASMRPLLVLLLAATCSATLQMPVSAAPLSRSVLEEDPRLTRKITIVAPRVYIGELLEQVSRQSDVTLEAGSSGDGAGDQVVSVYLKDVPLGKALNALYALVSYRNAEWHWIRSGAPGAYRYRLLRPRAAQLLGPTLKAQAQQSFEEHAATLLAAVDATPAERARLEQRNPAAAQLLRGDRLRNGLQLFKRSLSPEEQQAVLRGNAETKVGLDRLGPDGQHFIRSIYEGPNAPIRLGGGRPSPEPTHVVFRTGKHQGDISPSLMIHVDGLGAFGYMGGAPLEAEHRARVADLWMLRGDSADSSAEAHVPQAPRSPEPAAQSTPAGMAILDRRVKELADAVPLAVMARVPAEKRSDPGSPFGKPLREFLEHLRSRPPYLLHKWRDQVLLLTDSAWFTREGEATVPYEIVKWLRQKEAEGILSLDDLATVARRLDGPQLLTLSREFPVMSPAARWRELLAVYGESRLLADQLTSASGLPLRTLAQRTRSFSIPQFQSALQSGAAAAIRITQRDTLEQMKLRRFITIHLLSSDRKRLAASGFSYEGAAPKSEEPVKDARPEQ